MTETPSSLRRLANVLVSHAGRVMPPARRGWADAMAGEVSHVDDDGRALRWALGCVLAAHGERIRELHMMDLFRNRSCSSGAADSLQGVRRRVCHGDDRRLQDEPAGRDRVLRQDDARRRLPPPDSVDGSRASWLHAIWVTATLCYLVAIVGLLTRQRLAYVAVVAGLGLELAGTLLEGPIIEAVGVRANPNPSVLAQFLQFGLPLWSPLRRGKAAVPKRDRLAPTR